MKKHGLMVSLGEMFATADSADTVTVGSLHTGQLTLTILESICYLYFKIYHCLTPWGRVVPEKLTGFHLVNKYSAF